MLAYANKKGINEMLVVLKKSNSIYQFSFFKNEYFEGVKIFVNSDNKGYNVSLDFAKNEIERLQKNGYKKIEYPSSFKN